MNRNFNIAVLGIFAVSVVFVFAYLMGQRSAAGGDPTRSASTADSLLASTADPVRQHATAATSQDSIGTHASADSSAPRLAVGLDQSGFNSSFPAPSSIPTGGNGLNVLTPAGPVTAGAGPANQTPAQSPPPGSLPASVSPGSLPEALMPLAFLELPPDLAAARPQLAGAIANLQQDFVNAIGGPNQTPTDPAYYQRWVAAQKSSDEQYRLLVGNQAFLLQQISINNE